MSENPSTANTSASSTRGPDYRDLYLLIAGVVVGILLGPGVLGRIAPGTYDRWFIGSGPVLAEIDALNQKSQQTLEQLRQGKTDLAPEAVVGLHEQNRLTRVMLEARLQEAHRQHSQRLRGRLMAIVVALALVMVFETLLSADEEPLNVDSRPRWRWRLTTARYGLLAIWLALALAQPSLLREIPLLFVALLFLVALGVSRMPLGRTKSRAGA